jgi:hypothetical protein
MKVWSGFNWLRKVPVADPLVSNYWDTSEQLTLIVPVLQCKRSVTIFYLFITC